MECVRQGTVLCLICYSFIDRSTTPLLIPVKWPSQRPKLGDRRTQNRPLSYAMRYTHRRGLGAVTRCVRLKYAAINLKNLENWNWNNSFFSTIWLLYDFNCRSIWQQLGLLYLYWLLLFAILISFGEIEVVL